MIIALKVTFLELYNDNEYIAVPKSLEDQRRFREGRQKRPITLVVDGKARRRTVDTALNKQSSRSHAVFSINIQVKEKTLQES
uniref:Kinesin motor domain-containing protein n=1 Tax=Zea mays TaxID=4577 RepID=A0A804UFR0_MAIZE